MNTTKIPLLRFFFRPDAYPSRRFIRTVAALPLIVACTASLTRGAPVELLHNPGFEETLDEDKVKGLVRTINGIRVYCEARIHNWSGGIGQAASDESCIRSGERSLRITVPGGAREAAVGGRLRTPIRPGGIYRLSVWARGQGRLNLRVTQFNASNFISSDFLRDSPGLTLADEWQLLTAEYRPTDRRLHHATLTLVLTGDGSTAWADDASFTFDPDENPGIAIQHEPPERELTLEVTARDAAVEVWAGGKAVALEQARGRVRIGEGLTALAIRARAAGLRPGVRAMLTGCPETDGRWRAGTADGEVWLEAGFDDRAWRPAAGAGDGFMWSAVPVVSNLCFRQVLLWNETHYGPNRCILPRTREWGFSRGSMDNLLLALYSPLPHDLENYEFTLDVPAGVRLFGKEGHYFTRYVLNNRPVKIAWEAIRRDGAPYSRYRLTFANGQAAANGTQYARLPLRMAEAFTNAQSCFYYRRSANGNFTELDQEIPVAVLPPINGRQPKRILLSQYSPVGYSTMAPDHQEAVVARAAGIGFNRSGFGITEPGWGPEWVAYLRAYYRLLQEHHMGVILQPGGHFPLSGSLMRGEPREANVLGLWVEATPRAQARYFNDSVEWDISKWQHFSHRYCPDYALGEGRERFFELLRQMYERVHARTPDAETLWLDYEGSAWAAADGKGSVCFCDRCKESFRAYAKLPADADLSDQTILREHHAGWDEFRTWQTGEILRAVKQVVNAMGMKYMLYAPPLWKQIEGKADIVFANSPGCGVADSYSQGWLDEGGKDFRVRQKIPFCIGQRFAFLGAGVMKDAWLAHNALSDDGFVNARSWKSQILRVVAAYGGGIDMQDAAECVAGIAYWIGEATRILAAYEDFFLEGERTDALAAADPLEYPNVLVLKRGAERLVLLFNEVDHDVTVTLRNFDLQPGQRAEVFESGERVDASELPVNVPAGDAVAVHVK